MQDEIFDEEYENGGFLTPDCEDYEQLSDDELFFDNELKSTRLSVRISSPQAFSTDDFLAQIVEFPYEFRHYLDTRRAFSKALKYCSEEIDGFVSYEGGRSAKWETSFDYEDYEVTATFELAKPSDDEAYVFTVQIEVE